MSALLIEAIQRGDAIAVHMKLEPGLEVRVTIKRKLEIGNRGTNALGHEFPHLVEVRGEDGFGDPVWTPMRNPPQDIVQAAAWLLARAWLDGAEKRVPAKSVLDPQGFVANVTRSGPGGWP